MGPQVAFVICVVVPVLLIGGPLFLAWRKDRKAKAAQLKEAVVSIPRKVGAEDKLFGSVSTKDIAAALAAQNVVIDRKLIKLAEPIKAVGEHDVEVRFSADVSVTIKVQVIGVPA